MTLLQLFMQVSFYPFFSFPFSFYTLFSSSPLYPLLLLSLLFDFPLYFPFQFPLILHLFPFPIPFLFSSYSCSLSVSSCFSCFPLFFIFSRFLSPCSLVLFLIFYYPSSSPLLILLILLYFILILFARRRWHYLSPFLNVGLLDWSWMAWQRPILCHLSTVSRSFAKLLNATAALDLL